MSQKPLREITVAEIDAFNEDGVVHLPGMLDHQWIKRMRDAVDYIMAHPDENGGRGLELAPEDAEGRFAENTFMWKMGPRTEDFRALAIESPLGEIFATCMESSRVNFLEDTLFAKDPHTPQKTPWHQDQPYHPVNGTKAGAIWIPLDRCTLESGAVEWIPGSHKGPWFEAVNFDVTETLDGLVGHEGFDLSDAAQIDGFDTMPNFEKLRDQYSIVHFNTDPGDVIVFHELTVHTAPGNLTDRPRRALSLRFAGDDATYAERKSRWRLNPPFDVDLKHGEPFPPDHELYPQVFPPFPGPHLEPRIPS